MSSDTTGSSEHFYSLSDSTTDDEFLNLNVRSFDEFVKGHATDHAKASLGFYRTDFQTFPTTIFDTNKTRDQQSAPQSLYDIVVSHRWSVESLDYVTFCASFIMNTLKVYCGSVPEDGRVLNESSHRMFCSLEGLNDELTKLRQSQWHLNRNFKEGGSSCTRCDLKDLMYKRVARRKTAKQGTFCGICLAYVTSFPEHNLSEHHKKEKERAIDILYPHSCSKCDMRFYREQDLQCHSSIHTTDSDVNVESLKFEPRFCFICKMVFENMSSLKNHLSISLEHGCRMEIAKELASRGNLNPESNQHPGVKADVSSMQLNSVENTEVAFSSPNPIESSPPSNLTYYCEPCSSHILRSQVLIHEASNLHRQCCDAWIVEENREMLLATQKVIEEKKRLGVENCPSVSVHREPLSNRSDFLDFSGKIEPTSSLQTTVQNPQTAEGKSLKVIPLPAAAAKPLTNPGAYFCIPCCVRVPKANEKEHKRGKNHRKITAGLEIVDQGAVDATKEKMALISYSHMGEPLLESSGKRENPSVSATVKTDSKPLSIAEGLMGNDKDTGNSLWNEKVENEVVSPMLKVAASDAGESEKSEENVIKNEIEEAVRRYLYLEGIHPCDPSGLIYNCTLCNIRGVWRTIMSHVLSKDHMKLSKGKSQTSEILDQKLNLLSLLQMQECSLSYVSLTLHVVTRAVVEVGKLKMLNEQRVPFRESLVVNEDIADFLSLSSPMNLNAPRQASKEEVSSPVNMNAPRQASKEEAAQRGSSPSNNERLGADQEESISNMMRAVVIGSSASTSLKEEFDMVCDGGDISSFELECELCGVVFPIFNEDVELSIDMHVQNDPEHSLATAVPVERNAQSVAAMVQCTAVSKLPKLKQVTKVAVSVKGRKEAISNLLLLEQQFVVVVDGSTFQCKLCNVSYGTDIQIFSHILTRRHMSEKWFEKLSFEDQLKRPGQLWSLLQHKYSISLIYSAIKWIKQHSAKKLNRDIQLQTNVPKPGSSSQFAQAQKPNSKISVAVNSPKIINSSMAVASVSVSNNCKICSRDISNLSKNGKKLHQRKCNNPDAFCDLCSKNLSSMAEMGRQQHRKDCLINVKVICETCSKDLTSMHEMSRQQHKKDCLAHKNKVVCKTCSKDLSKMAEARRQQHRNNCVLCETCLKNISSLTMESRQQHRRDCLYKKSYEQALKIVDEWKW